MDQTVRQKVKGGDLNGKGVMDIYGQPFKKINASATSKIERAVFGDKEDYGSDLVATGEGRRFVMHNSLIL